MLPWLETHEPGNDKCGQTSTEECLARYVCCIDDYCCEEPECADGCIPANNDCGPNSDQACDCCAGYTCDDGIDGTNLCVSCVDTGGMPVDTCDVCCDENADCKMLGNNGKYKCKCAGAECDTGCCPMGEGCNADGKCEVFLPGCETAVAKDPANGICFQQSPESDPTFKRWGWTNGPYTAGTVDLDIYGRAAQCITTNGQGKVGEAKVTVSGDTVTVTVTPNDPNDVVNGDPTLAAFKFTEYHIQVSCDPEQHALNGVTPTVAPGQYTVVKDAIADLVLPGTPVTVDFAVGEPQLPVFPIDGLTETGVCTSNKFWVIIHAVSCPGTNPNETHHIGITRVRPEPCRVNPEPAAAIP